MGAIEVDRHRREEGCAMQPFLSIVIANCNYGRFLEEAIQSVLSQTGEGLEQVCPDEVELIVIDGGSTDNSVEIIKKYACGLPAGVARGDSSILRLPSTPIVYWVSEPDKGQSDAFNKGFSKTSGKFLTWLNADDVMLPGTIKKLKIAAEKHPECEWFVGGCFWLDPGMRIVNCGRGRPFSEIRYREGNVSVWGPSSFFTKRLLDSVGGVDVRFHYTMDTDLWLRFACKAGARYMPFCDYAWGLRLHPDAKMSRHNFSKDGKLMLGCKNVIDERQRRAEEQKRREGTWKAEYFSPQPVTWLILMFSVSWFRVFAARMDLWRYRGKYYREYFK